jgi:Bifunctional DNA primase/polymerase, N-terminal
VSLDFTPPASNASGDWARAYAAAGMAVFPCASDGAPLISKAQGGNGFRDATTDPDQIRGWWACWPHAEIGWGIAPGLVVVDLDEKKGKRGLADFFKRECVPAREIATPIAVTPSGGLHLVYDDCGRSYPNAAPIIPGTGIDARVGGLGYVVLPRAGNGREWIKPLTMPLAPAPSWLPVRRPDRPGGEAKPYSGEASPGALKALERACEDIRSASPGSRNAAINGASYSIGRRIGAGQLDEAAARGALVHAVEQMIHPGNNLGKDVAKVDCALAAGKARPREEDGPRGATFAGVLDIAGQIAKAAPRARDCITRWGASLMAENVRTGIIRAELAHQVLFEAAMRNGLSGDEAAAIIEANFRSEIRG